MEMVERRQRLGRDPGVCALVGAQRPQYPLGDAGAAVMPRDQAGARHFPSRLAFAGRDATAGAGENLAAERDMAAKIERMQPAGVNVRIQQGKAAYSHVVTVTGPATTVYIAGQLA